MKKIVIDGPGWSGKTTLARRLAKELDGNFVFLDSEKMYDAIGYFVMRDGIDPNGRDVADELCSRHQLSFGITEGRDFAVLLDGKDIAEKIRSGETWEVEEVRTTFFAVKNNPVIKTYIAKTLREIAENYNVIVEGEDIGVSIFPDADVMFFLTADTDEQARRIWQVLKESGVEAEYTKVYDAFAEKERKEAKGRKPVKLAEDVFIIDSTRMSAEQVFENAMGIIRGGMENE